MVYKQEGRCLPSLVLDGSFASSWYLNSFVCFVPFVVPYPQSLEYPAASNPRILEIRGGRCNFFRRGGDYTR